MTVTYWKRALVLSGFLLACSRQETGEAEPVGGEPDPSGSTEDEEARGAGGSAADAPVTGGAASHGPPMGAEEPIDCDQVEELELTASLVDARELLREEEPSPAGGIVEDGVYDVVDYVAYGPLPRAGFGGGFKQTLRFRGGGALLDLVRQDALAGEQTASLYVFTEGATMVWRGACPEDLRGRHEEMKYTATSERVELFLRQVGLTTVITYERQAGRR